MKVKFVPQNVEFEIQPGESVLHVAQDHGIYIKSVCKGVPSCAECRCRVVDGEHNVLQPGPEELSLIGTGHFIDRRRLSCQLKCFGDITIDLSEQISKQQGLIGGQKKKKLSIKDDRIEDASVRAASSDGDDEAGEGETPAAAPQSRRQPPPKPKPEAVQTAEGETEDEDIEGAEDEDGDEGDELQRQAQGGKPGGGGGRRRRRRGGRGGRGGDGRGQGGGGGGQSGGGRGNGQPPPNRGPRA